MEINLYNNISNRRIERKVGDLVLSELKASSLEINSGAPADIVREKLYPKDKEIYKEKDKKRDRNQGDLFKDVDLGNQDPVSLINEGRFHRFIRIMLQKPKKWIEYFGESLKNIEFIKWVISRQREYYVVNGDYKNLNIILGKIGLQTVNKQFLNLAEKEVEKRSYSSTRRESNFFPVWVIGTKMPRSPSRKNCMGVLVYTTMKRWIFVLNIKNFYNVYEYDENEDFYINQKDLITKDAVIDESFLRNIFEQNLDYKGSPSELDEFKKISEKKFKRVTDRYFWIVIFHRFKNKQIHNRKFKELRDKDIVRI